VRTEPRVLKFHSGTRKKHWNKNCVALGLASGFLEPLESTSIHLIQKGIIRLLQMFPSNGIRAPDIEEFNQQMRQEIEHTRDFIILHYHVNERTDSDFWIKCREMEVPESLKHRIELFKQTGRVFRMPNELFGEASWTAVMFGQGLDPEQYHPIVDMMDEKELKEFLKGLETSVVNLVRTLPEHQKFIDNYCKVSA
jgi:tryptophan halogenase